MENTWPGGVRRAISQKRHKQWNANNYPGTRQLCNKCGEPTGGCEEDTIWSEDGEPLCEECAADNVELRQYIYMRLREPRQ